MPFLIADRPDDDRRRVTVALDHCLKLRHAFGAGAHLPGLAHHHHAHAIAGLNQFRRRHIVRGANAVASHALQYTDTERLQAVRHGRANPGVILVIACALNFDRLAVQEETVIGIETEERTPKVTRSASRTLSPVLTVTIAV